MISSTRFTILVVLLVLSAFFHASSGQLFTNRKTDDDISDIVATIKQVIKRSEDLLSQAPKSFHAFAAPGAEFFIKETASSVGQKSEGRRQSKYFERVDQIFDAAVADLIEEETVSSVGVTNLPAATEE